MDNLFFVHPQNITGNQLEIVGQEAIHAAKVLRFSEGDDLYAADGKGTHYKTRILTISKKKLISSVTEKIKKPEPPVKKVLAFGAIKKRDRLEFAVEKAVELNAWEICIFNADHSERSKINESRIQSIVLSAFKQSKRSWLPAVRFLKSLDQVFEVYGSHHPIMAHFEEGAQQPKELSHPENLLLVGPEGGFSAREVELAKAHNASLVSLGPNRLRAETAVLSMLSHYLFSD